MTDEFRYDVFLSHSQKDKRVARALAKKLRKDGVAVWFDEWALQPGANIPHSIEEGLERSRALIFLMSENAFGSDWVRLETEAFRFRDPLNRQRGFIPLRLDDAPLKGFLAQFAYINWQPGARSREYRRLLAACPPAARRSQRLPASRGSFRTVHLEAQAKIQAYAFTHDGRRAVTGAADGSVTIWDVDSGRLFAHLGMHSGPVRSLTLDIDGSRVVSGSNDSTVRIWEVWGGAEVTLEGHPGEIWSVAWSPDRQFVLSGGNDRKMRLWDVASGSCVRIFEGHTNWIKCVAWSDDGRQAVSCGWDKTIRVWDVETGRCLRTLTGHIDCVRSVVWTSRQRLISASDDRTIRLWSTENGRCLRVFEGHTESVTALTLSENRDVVLSGSSDGTLRLWDVDTGRFLRVFERHDHPIEGVAWLKGYNRVLSGDALGVVHSWDVAEFTFRAPLDDTPDQVQYTNAKVLLVGESGAGKTGLSKRLALDHWEPSDSTVGAWATQWKLPVSPDRGVEREIWLWDFGGQADQRLIHQLYMDETAVAVLVFDGQKEDLFETLYQWDRDLTRASRRPFVKLLVAGRVDAGGLRVSRAQIEEFRRERGYQTLLETSAKTRHGCQELKQTIVDSIRWNEIPWRTSPLLFKRLKEELMRLKDSGRVLMRFNELRTALALSLAEEGGRFTDEELQAVISLLAGPGVVLELKFGHWILLQPERINAYAQAVIQTLREDEHERGCLLEERVLDGNLAYQSTLPRLDPDEERFVLLAMHQTLVERGICLREHTEEGPLLVFPSYYRRERPELSDHPAVLVTYRFTGFIDEIYATLVVRLHHTNSFIQDRLWRYAADFKTLAGKQLGVKMSRRSEGTGELAVYFDPSIGFSEKMIFSKYVHEHLLKTAKDVQRLRHYVCPFCFTPVGNPDVAMQRLADNKPDILCIACEQRFPLLDDLEALFSSRETNYQVKMLEDRSDDKLERESRARSLAGEVISTVALSGQVIRELRSRENEGIHMELEVYSLDGHLSGQKLYLHLLSERTELQFRHSYRPPRERAPLMVVFRESDGEVRWASPEAYRANQPDERFDVMAIRALRSRLIGSRLRPH